MKKLSLLLVLLLFMACEDGIIITVPASSSYSFAMPSSQINADPDNLFSGSETVDITQFFDEDAQQIESIKLDKLVYEVSNYENTSGNLVLMDLTIQTKVNGNTNDILTIFGLVVENTGEIIAFEDGNPASALSAAQVASLESIMDNLEPFEMIVTGDFTDDIDGDFDISIAWDITASVAQPTSGGG
ncbi:hypothetical protein [Roseivirga sp.]|uniref:hypothetical protein n=1 Tax=Roseivirga sp. TaxID=1964215 RepID=UPI003B8B28A1